MEMQHDFYVTICGRKATQRRPEVIELVNCAHEAVRKFIAFNPARTPFIEVTWRGNAYSAQCYYHDNFTGSRCTFARLYSCPKGTAA